MSAIKMGECMILTCVLFHVTEVSEWNEQTWNADEWCCFYVAVCSWRAVDATEWRTETLGQQQLSVFTAESFRCVFTRQARSTVISGRFIRKCFHRRCFQPVNGNIVFADHHYKASLLDTGLLRVTVWPSGIRTCQRTPCPICIDLWHKDCGQRGSADWNLVLVVCTVFNRYYSCQEGVCMKREPVSFSDSDYWRQSSTVNVSW